MNPTKINMPITKQRPTTKHFNIEKNSQLTFITFENSNWFLWLNIQFWHIKYIRKVNIHGMNTLCFFTSQGNVKKMKQKQEKRQG